ncbi:MAG: hypothetical protein KME53_03535 [Candidatus Thiodiazotropha sp. (ex Clathrolucina costata)]|nr:hypothetical protein [Candidatus Thiodiazotropha taylori]
MTTNRKGRAGWHQATLKTSKHTCNFTGLVARVKGFIVTLALWGLLPVAVADWLINLGGQRDV